MVDQPQVAYKFNVDEEVHEVSTGFNGFVKQRWPSFRAMAEDKEQFITMMPDEWLAAQENKFTAEQVEMEAWYQVNDITGNGAFISCESRLASNAVFEHDDVRVIANTSPLRQVSQPIFYE